MMTHLASFELHRPTALDEPSWDAVQDGFARLQRAVTQDDRPLVVGSAKDLIESVARSYSTLAANPRAAMRTSTRC
jgi:hypothetical protein